MEAQCYFDSLASAAQALETVLLDARVTDKKYEFEGLSAQQIKNAGLTLRGDIKEVLNKIDKINGVVIFSNGDRDE